MDNKFCITLALGVVALLGVVACSTTQVFNWDKPGATEEQTKTDSANCNFQVRQMGKVLLPSEFRSLMIQCMKGKGYSEESVK
jgi:hypothetical protein